MSDSIKNLFKLEPGNMVLMSSKSGYYVMGAYVAEKHIGSKEHQVVLRIENSLINVELKSYPYVSVGDQTLVTKSRLDIASAAIENLLKSALRDVAPLT